jgi:S1-C subfamily serine protease
MKDARPLPLRLAFPSIVLCALLLACIGAPILAEEPRLSPDEAEAKFPKDSTPIARDQPASRLTSYADVLKRVTPSVVSVFPAHLAKPGDARQDELLKRFFGEKPGAGESEDDRHFRSVGSGVIVSADGYILTNSHVVHLENGKLADEIVVEFSNQWRFPASIIGVDPKADIAVIKVDGKDLPALPMADSKNVEVGDLAFVVGNPFKVGMTATMGMISATKRTGVRIGEPGGYQDFIQTDAAINPGNSGGALCDARGRLIGINTGMISGGGGSVGIGFAVSINLARRVLCNLLENGAPARGFAGVRVRSVDDAAARAQKLAEVKGAIVEEILADGPGANAGLQKNDVVLRVGEEEIDGAGAFGIAIGFAPPGTKLVFHVLREGQAMDLPVTVAREEDSAKPGASLEIDELPRVQLREQAGETPGLVVEKIDPLSPYAKALEPGMVIIEINDAPVATRPQASAALRQGANKLRVRSEGQTDTLTLVIK